MDCLKKFIKVIKTFAILYDIESRYYGETAGEFPKVVRNILDATQSKKAIFQRGIVAED